MGKHYGYGLAQWTTENRKRGLYEYTEQQYTSIGDLQAQCEYLYRELETSFKTVLSVLKTAQDIGLASDRVLLRFEAPKDAESQIETRRKYSKEIYDLMEGNMVYFGSARIDENGHASGGVAGDQTGKEVSTQEYYMHEKGWNVLRAKEPQVREAIAQDMEWACINNNIGYVSAEFVKVHDSLPQGLTIKELSYGGDVSDKVIELIEYAKQFLGNPYVYGGTSLTNGTDCSGFTMRIFGHFGYSLNRSSGAQSYNGTPVSLSEIKPGDLLFYSYGSAIGHVAIYIGNGQIIHASTERTGICIGNAFYQTPCCARRIIY
jgi:hypothetical protein